MPEEFLQTASDLDDIAQRYKDEIRNQTVVFKASFAERFENVFLEYLNLNFHCIRLSISYTFVHISELHQISIF